MINLSPCRKKFFKIDSETKEEIELEHVSEQNNLLFTSMKTLSVSVTVLRLLTLMGMKKFVKLSNRVKSY